MPFKSYREELKTNWGVETTGQVSHEQIRLGAELRIADAVEKMAENHVRLMEDRDMYERWYRSEQKTSERLRRKIAGLRGYINRLKKRAR